MDTLIAIIKGILLSDENIEAKRYRIKSFIIKVATWAKDKLEECPESDSHLNFGPIRMQSGKINISEAERKKEERGRAKYAIYQGAMFALRNHRAPTDDEEERIMDSWDVLSAEQKEEYKEDKRK